MLKLMAVIKSQIWYDRQTSLL